MRVRSRRDFLADVGRGMMVASVGTTLATELGIQTVFGYDSVGTLTFGRLEPLVALMQDTAAERLQPLLVEKLRSGTDLRTLVAAGALANARSFGGQHYVGYHTLMALMPAYEMSKLLPEDRRALPVFKVLYRNTDTIQKDGGRRNEILRPVQAGNRRGAITGDRLRELMRKHDMDGAEQVFAKMSQGDIEDAYNNLQLLVQDDIDVHRVVLAWRAWDTLKLTGPQHAHTMLRQSVRHCVDREETRIRRGYPEPPIRTVLPRLLEQYGLLGRSPGTTAADDAWVDELSRNVFAGSRAKAAEAVAVALAEGFSPEVIGEAISLAANRLLLQDPGRTSDETKAKPRGSVHGASVGVHASDSANAWRHIARVTNDRNTMASLIVGGYHTAGQQHRVSDHPFPFGREASDVRTTAAEALLRETEACIRSSDQARVCILAERYGALGHSPKPLFDMLLKYAVSEDGALHAEKYYRTVSEEFATTRPAFRWRHLVALARVTTSEYGHPAPGRDQARDLLDVT